MCESGQCVGRHDRGGTTTTQQLQHNSTGSDHQVWRCVIAANGAAACCDVVQAKMEAGSSPELLDALNRKIATLRCVLSLVVQECCTHQHTHSCC